MIRKCSTDDIEIILSIWLSASVKAHDFIDADFWASQVSNMREIYLPASETYVFEQDSKIVGFYSLHENILAAIFVDIRSQGHGIGKALLAHAQTIRSPLSLSVYKENTASYEFYLSQGFLVISEQKDKHTGHLEFTMSTPT
ncbi:N-acetyltransferase [Thalassotalea atypica]|uniref:N-acetyltransferase n=1 Tax=Thalassotalea atypica TaxID=2054316 RepID=UPI002573CD60|nr:N-acetyltransferase [Thalassotalea atypica]